MKLVRKVKVDTKAAGDDSLEFILSDDTQDRMGDVINPNGWVLDNFKKNPIALFNHSSNFPIGKWKNVRVKNKKLVGELELADEGTSDRIDEIIRLVRQGILRAVSVGFQPIDAEPLKDNTGIFFREQELLETSLVSVPANPSAIQLARSLHTSDETIDLVFGEQASVRKTTTGETGEQANIPTKRKTKTMTLSERIVAAQERLKKLRDDLTAHIEKSADTPDDETSNEVTEALTKQIEVSQKSLDNLVAAEKQLAAISTETSVVTPTTAQKAGDSRPIVFPQAKQTIKPGDRIMRSLVSMVVSRALRGSGDERSPAQVLAERYGEDGKVDDATKTVFDMVTRTASAPATTFTSGWASQLVATENAAFMELLMPASVYPGLSNRGMRLNFGRGGIISIPTRASTPTIAGSFVLEGSPIPVRQGAFSAQTLSPKKMAVISVWTREIGQHSTPAIEGLIRNAIQEDTSVALDTVLLDATAASTTRPAGIRNGVSTTTATAGGGFAALVGD
ncbi:MAG TPA: HK97 family phage prohead protease, partial [Gemmatimonadaceae bacterium]|nr:HK97 family phage prohead protease [Gemmatimonadaceae bacterium]